MIGVSCEIAMAATLGQPLECTKTYLANHNSTLPIRTAAYTVYKQRGLRGLYAGLLPWSVLESCSGGALIFFSHAAYTMTRRSLESHHTPLDARTQFLLSHTIGGAVGGTCQGLLLVPILRMKNAEMTKAKNSKSTLHSVGGLLRRDGVAGLWRGGSMVLARQVTNWGTRMGLARYIEERICRGRGGERCELRAVDRMGASMVAGAVSCWNHPFDVAATRMQSSSSHASRSVRCAFTTVYSEAGLAGFSRGLGARMLLSAYATLFMVAACDSLRNIILGDTQ